METFFLDKTKKIVIHGAGGDGRKILSGLKSQGFDLLCVIDKRAESIGKIDDIDVITFDKFSYISKENVVIVVTLKNLFSHIDIAKEWLCLGYNNIIYKPLPVLQGSIDKEWTNISNAYDKLLDNSLTDIENTTIYKTRASHLNSIKDRLFINSDSKCVTCWAPVENVYNYDEDSTYGRLPMIAYFPLVSLYRYLLGNSSFENWEDVKRDFLLYATEWIKKVGENNTIELQNSMISSRIGVYNQMQKEAELDNQFFIRNAIEVRCGDNNQLYMISSGRNRVSYLIAKGYRYVPVKMTKEDYQQWINNKDVPKVLDYIDKNVKCKFFSTIQNPMLVDQNIDYVDYIRLFCIPCIQDLFKTLYWSSLDNDYKYDTVNYELYKKNHENCSVGINIDDMGIISRILTMSRIHNWQDTDKEIVPLLNQLLNCKGNIYLHENYEKRDKYDFWFIDSNYDISLNFFSGTRKLYYLQWGIDEAGLQRIVKIGYKIDRRLFETNWNNQVVKGYVLII